MFKKIINLIINIVFIGILIGIGYYYLYLHKNNTIADSLILDLQNYTVIENDYVSLQSVNLLVSEKNSNSTQTLFNQYYRYYYQQLDDTAKVIYSSLEYNLDNLKKENFVIDFSTKFNELLNKPNRNGITK